MSDDLAREMSLRQTGHWERPPAGLGRPVRLRRASPAMSASMRHLWQKMWPGVHTQHDRLVGKPSAGAHTARRSREVSRPVHAHDAGDLVEPHGLGLDLAFVGDKGSRPRLSALLLLPSPAPPLLPGESVGRVTVADCRCGEGRRQRRRPCRRRCAGRREGDRGRHWDLDPLRPVVVAPSEALRPVRRRVGVDVVGQMRARAAVPSLRARSRRPRLTLIHRVGRARGARVPRPARDGLDRRELVGVAHQAVDGERKCARSGRRRAVGGSQAGWRRR